MATGQLPLRLFGWLEWMWGFQVAASIPVLKGPLSSQCASWRLVDGLLCPCVHAGLAYSSSPTQWLSLSLSLGWNLGGGGCSVANLCLTLQPPRTATRQPSLSFTISWTLSLFPFFPPVYWPGSDGIGCHDLSFFECWALSLLFYSSLSFSSRSSLVPLHFLPLE